MKKLCYIGIIGTLLSATACDSDVLIDSGNGYQTAAATGEPRYLAVRLVPIDGSTGSRADDDDATFKNGSDEDCRIDPTAVTFYFFDADGNACNVGTDASLGQQVNFVSADGDAITWTANADGSAVSHYSDAILTLGSDKANPASVVAVLNDPNGAANIASLDDMRSYLQSVGYRTAADGTQYFTMSNSVYADENGDIVDATPITTANITYLATKVDSITPLTIYVERVVAKVDVEGNASGNVFPINDSSYYVKINGWQLFDTAPKGYLLKNIRGYSSSEWEWNSTEKYRSYWALTSWPLRDTENSDNQLQQQRLSWNQISYPIGEDNALYPFENTGNYPTKVIVAATIYEDEACTTPLTICRYLGTDYTLDGLRTQMAGLLASTLYVNIGGTIQSITADYIDFTPVDGCYVKVVPKTGVTYYDSTGAELSAADLASIQTNTIDKLPKSEIWKDGKCYYYANIKHLNDASALVRNHWYRLTLNAFTGLGTPVYDPEYVFDPTRPDDSSWVISTTIKVREWNKVGRIIDFMDYTEVGSGGYMTVPQEDATAEDEEEFEESAEEEKA